MKYTGSILKMKSQLSTPISYHFLIGDHEVNMNDLLDKNIRLSFLNEIFCTACGNKTYKSFQGFCYPCFQSSPLASECIIHPERCQAHLGIGRDMEWEKKYHLTPQIVYLALTAGTKVGITREPQIPTRWIDQGAVQAIIFARTPNRYLAGMVEVALKSFMADKTHWQKMLKNEVLKDVDLIQLKAQMKDNISSDLKQYIVDDSTILDLNYPVLEYPKKVKSINFDKVPMIEGKLTGIKGQYLMFDYQFVFNVRKHIGYMLSFEH